MRHVLVLALMLACAAHATETTLVKKTTAWGPNGSGKKTSWFRNEIEVMTQTLSPESKDSLCVLTPRKLPDGRAALVLWFKDKHISSLFSGPALIGYSFSIDDLEATGIPDLIQIKNAETDRVIGKRPAGVLVVG